MPKNMTITYEVGNNLYLNITNDCPCDCVFCIRKEGEGAYGSDPLWLDHEPDFSEVKAALDARDLDKYEEIVFCGYGEPTTRYELLCRIAKHIKSRSNVKIRLNTNGLCDLIAGKDIVPELKGAVDIISISLNAPTTEEYLQVTRPSFGEISFEAMKSFAVRCKDAGIDTMFTVVDVIPAEQIEASRKLCEALGVRLRVREFV